MTATTVQIPASTSYSALPYFKKRLQKVHRALGFAASDVTSWRAWRRKTLKKLQSLTGFDTMIDCPLDPRITETVEFPDYIRQRVEIQTEPGIIMPFYVLIPRAGKAPYYTVLTPHGHASGGKDSPAGRSDIPEIAKQIQVYNYDYAVQFARAGLIAMAPDARGFGERREELAKGNLLSSSCQWLNNMAFPLGQTVTGMWAWDLRRLVDYVLTRDDCRHDRIGCAGLSGGGLQTLWASAFEPRISAAVVSGYFYGYEESLLELHGNCSCNYVPHLYENVDIGDVAALIAPRPLLFETGTQDPLNGRSGLENVLSQLRITRKAYRVLEAAANLQHDIFEGGHKWHGVVAVPWLKKQLECGPADKPAAR